jgi:hypothetical protein
MHISYSQFNLWSTCPYQWYLKYVKGIKDFSGSIHTVFGTAIHKTIQTYLDSMYNDTIKSANEIEINLLLKKNMMDAYKSDKRRNKGIDFCNVDELKDMYVIGTELLESFKSKRNKYFPKRDYELVGIEKELDFEIQNNVNFIGSLDVVIRNKKNGQIIIFDIKTSAYGWTKSKKDDIITRSQLILYKHFYSKQYNVPIEKIDVSFFILKKRVYQNNDWTISRLQEYKPPSAKRSINKSLKLLNDFIEYSFELQGQYKDRFYDKATNKKNCVWCPFKQTDKCDKWKIKK